MRVRFLGTGAAGGLASLRRWWSERSGDPIPLHASPEAIDVIQRRVKRLDHVRLRAIEPGARIRIADLTVSALEVPHARERPYRTYAWRLTDDGVTLVYASDVAELTPALRRFSSGARLLVIDGAMWRRRIFTHLTIDESLPRLCDWPVDRILLTQIGRTAPPHERLERDASTLCDKARPAYDGMEIRLAGRRSSQASSSSTVAAGSRSEIVFDVADDELVLEELENMPQMKVLGRDSAALVADVARRLVRRIRYRTFVRNRERRAMTTKAERIEARLTLVQRRQIEQAAELAGESVSAFMVLAALERAENVVVEQATTVVPATYFDRFVASLDEPDEAPRLARAARRRRRIKAA